MSRTYDVPSPRLDFESGKIKEEAAAVLCWRSHEEILHIQGKRNPSKTVGFARGHQMAETETTITENYSI